MRRALMDKTRVEGRKCISEQQRGGITLLVQRAGTQRGALMMVKIRGWKRCTRQQQQQQQQQQACNRVSRSAACDSPVFLAEQQAQSVLHRSEKQDSSHYRSTIQSWLPVEL